MSPRVVRVHTEDNHFQRAEVLKRNRVKRQKYGRFFVEGVKAINEAVRAGWPIESFLYARGAPLSDWAKGILAASRASTHLELAPALMEKLSDKEETSELLAVAEMAADDMARIPVGDDLCVILLDRPQSPGNLGTTLRSAAAFGVDGVLITGHAADLYDPRTVRSSVGTVFTQPIVRVSSHADLVAWLASVRARVPALRVAVTSHVGTTDIDACDFSGPTLLVMGNETHGASAAYRELADALVRIPLGGATTSLNVSLAASIFLYEIDRQRRARELGRGVE